MKKKANKKGFTIMEMLIVVAIIAATDVANIRAAYAELQVAILTDEAAVPTVKTTTGATKGFSDYLDTALNYDNKLTYTYTDGTKSATITYKTEKLTGGNGADDHTFTWKVNPVDIK